MYGTTLASTGATALVAGSVLTGQVVIMGVAMAAVTIGAVLLRLVWRRGKAVNVK